MQELKFMPFNRTPFLVRNPMRPGQNESLLLANRSSLSHMGQGNENSNDPKGRLLRQLRVSQNFDPAELATQACISLAQLYELELGLSERFYSPSLREQAARRVAQLLHADWDHLEKSVHTIKSINKVIHLQRPQVSHSLPLGVLNSSDSDGQLNATHDTLTTTNDLVPLGLSTPCVEDPVAGTLPAATPPQTSRDERSWLAVLRVPVTLLFGVLAGYVWAQWGPYELVLPWQPEWLRKLAETWQIALPF